MNLSSELNPRLIVLLPESLAGDLEFATRIHRVAAQSQKNVVYLTILDDPDHALTVSRNLATMKAVTESNLVHAGSVQVPTDRWFAKLKEILGPEDTVVCQAEQSVRQGVFRTIPIADYLHSILGKPMIIMEGYYHPRMIQVSAWVKSLFFWLGAIAILAGFTWLELQADSAFPGFIHPVVLIVILIMEIGSVWLWSRFVHR